MHIYKKKSLMYNNDTLIPNGITVAWPANLMEDTYVAVKPHCGIYLIRVAFGRRSAKGHTNSGMTFLLIFEIFL